VADFTIAPLRYFARCRLNVCRSIDQGSVSLTPHRMTA